MYTHGFLPSGVIIATLFLVLQSTWGTPMLLVSGLKGEISTAPNLNNEVRSLQRGRFLPRGFKVGTSAGEGLELLGAGWMLRLGQNTMFSATEGGVILERGSLLARPMRSSSKLNLATTHTLVRFQGKGTFVSETLKDGSLRIIGLAGKVSIQSDSGRGRKQVDLLPGQRVERYLSGRFGKIIDLDLGKLLETSRLVGMFPNQQSFSDQLFKAARNQARQISPRIEKLQVDVVHGVSYGTLTSSSFSRLEKVPDPEKIRVSGEPANALPQPTIYQNPTSPSLSKSRTKRQALPLIPGPPLQFHISSRPTNNFKEKRSEDIPGEIAPFPGRIFKR